MSFVDSTSKMRKLRALPHCCYSSLSSSPTVCARSSPNACSCVCGAEPQALPPVQSFLVTYTYIVIVETLVSTPRYGTCAGCLTTIANSRITLLLRPLLEGAVQAPRPTQSAGCTGKAPARTTWVSSDRGIGSEAFPTHTHMTI